MKLTVGSHVGLRRRHPGTWGWATLCYVKPLFDGDVTSGGLAKQYALAKRPFLISFMTQIELDYIFLIPLG